MEIETIRCDRCGFEGEYPSAFNEHIHPELEIGGVPMNIWTPESYSIPRTGSQTPLTKMGYFGGATIYFKDESKNPTASFKDRGIKFLVDDALKRGFHSIAIPSTGNAAVSLSKYASEAGIEAVFFIPKTTPEFKKDILSGKIIQDESLVESYEHFFRFCSEKGDIYNGAPYLNIPFTIGLGSLAEEVIDEIGTPDWIVIPCGSGSNILGQYYAFSRHAALPKVVSVQAKGADPITVGYSSGSLENVVVLESPVPSMAEAIASDTCFNYFKIMDILRRTQGIAVSVSDDEISSIKGADSFEYSSRSAFAALQKIKARVSSGEKVVVVATAGRRDNDV